MKTRSVGVLLTLAVMFGLTAAARGQTQDALTANIPFDFVVGGTTLPAGLYSVDRPSPGEPNLLQLRREDGNPVALVFSSPVRQSDGTIKLVFNKYNENYLLSEIWTPAGVHQLPVSRQERRLAKAVDQGMVSVAGAR